MIGCVNKIKKKNFEGVRVLLNSIHIQNTKGNQTVDIVVCKSVYDKRHV